MPLYRGSIHKYIVGNLPSSGWLNTYHISAASENDAMDVLSEILVVEQNVHWSNVQFDRLSVRLESDLATAGIQRATAAVGERDATGEDFLPLFCVARVILADSVNRPDQRYLRLPISEGEQTNGVISNALNNFIADNYIAPLFAIPGVVSSSAVPYTLGSTAAAVQNRQRGWHRRQRVGFRRGWVPV